MQETIRISGEAMAELLRRLESPCREQVEKTEHMMRRLQEEYEKNGDVWEFPEAAGRIPLTCKIQP